METIKITKKHNGFKVGQVVTVTTMTAAKRVADGLAEYLEAKEVIEVKEDKVEIETKEEKVEVKTKGKRTIKAPK